MATINLGRVKPVFRGAYAGGTSYVVDDIVTYSNETYICILASTGNLPTDTTYWTKLAAKGTDGTDLTSTLTTQGDILYRDGSGLQRLGAGTAGQVLQTGGAGANPSWGTVSSDYVKLATTEITSQVSSVIFDGYFSSTYERYLVTWDNVFFANNSTNMKIRFNEAGSEVTTASYVNAQVRAYRGTASSGVDNDNYSSWGDNGATIGHYLGSSTLRACSGEILLVNPLDTSNGLMSYGKIAYYFQGTAANQLNITNFVIHLDLTPANTGIKFMSDNANYALGKFKLYGIK